MIFDEPDPDVSKYLCELQNYSRTKDIIFKRHVSYDFCYNYFQSFKNKEEIKDNMELSCLQLGFYLASWGLYRGSNQIADGHPTLKGRVCFGPSADCWES